jgi:hypothetical protein
MPLPVSELARLSLLIQRILDEEVLYDTQGETLLTQSEAARLCLEEGDTEMALRHIAQVALFTEALVHSAVLDLANGRAVLETTQRLLTGDTD